VLGLIAGEWLYEHRPTLPEGELSRLKSSLVSATALGSSAQSRPRDVLRLGIGEERSGGRTKPSLLADSMEAVFGAVYLDGGMKAARAVIVPMIERAMDGRAEQLPSDSKTALQEAAQSRGWPLPEYRLVAQEVPTTKSSSPWSAGCTAIASAPLRVRARRWRSSAPPPRRSNACHPPRPAGSGRERVVRPFRRAVARDRGLAGRRARPGAVPGIVARLLPPPAHRRAATRAPAGAEDGLPRGRLAVDCRSNLVHETLGRFLVRAGAARGGRAQRSPVGLAEPRGALGEILVEKKILGSYELFRYLQQNLAHKLLDLFTWKDARSASSPTRRRSPHRSRSRRRSSCSPASCASRRRARSISPSRRSSVGRSRSIRGRTFRSPISG
jgi:hypothetical protein